MTSTLWLDLETYCEVPIKNGTYAYAEACEIMLFQYALDDGAAECWDVTTGAAMPADLVAWLMDPAILLNANNSMFDRTVLRICRNATPLTRRAANDIPRWRDTMVKALAHALPGALGKTGPILGLKSEDQKDVDGKRLVHLFCKPLPKNSKLRRATRETHPDDWQRFIVYGKRDVHTMRIVDGKLPNWNYTGAELSLWHLDQRINDRGIAIDLSFAEAALATASREQARLAAEACELTGGAVSASTQRDKLLAHLLADYGVTLPDMKSSTLERRINDPDLPIGVRELLENRLQSAMGGASKYKSLLKAVSGDGRLRGVLQFDGASRTRRAAGRTFQPQNLFRPPDYVADAWEEHIHSVKVGAADLLYENTMEVLAATVRGALVAGEGKKLVVADLSNIEGRDQAWLAGESWKLQAFSDYDAGIGPDLYKLAYSKSFGIKPDDVDKGQRQIGKVQELALGYEGGVGAFATFALAYGVDLEKLGEDAYGTLPPDIREEAEGFLEWWKSLKKSTYGMSDRTFVVCDSFKRAWRRGHPNIVTLWADMKASAQNAIESPGKTILCRKFKMRRDGAWLRILLPSGRYLCYPSPQVADDGQISYMGSNQYTRKWERLKTYGGKLFENACQSVARDVMYDNMFRIEEAGYNILLSVHDELITETPDTDAYSAKALSSLLATRHPWCPDLPLAAEGFEAYRYRK